MSDGFDLPSNEHFCKATLQEKLLQCISLKLNVETAFLLLTTYVYGRILRYIKSNEFLGKFVHACALYTRLSFGVAHAMEDSLGMRLTMSVHACVCGALF